MAEQKTSWVWYLLPVLFSILGGIVGYFLLKDKDKKTAKKLIYVGLVVFALEIIVPYIIQLSYLVE